MGEVSPVWQRAVAVRRRSARDANLAARRTAAGDHGAAERGPRDERDVRKVLSRVVGRSTRSATRQAVTRLTCRGAGPRGPGRVGG